MSSIFSKWKVLDDSQEVARLVKCGSLHVRLNIHVLTEDLGQRALTNLCQLRLCEPHCWVLVFIPETSHTVHIVILTLQVAAPTIKETIRPLFGPLQ